MKIPELEPHCGSWIIVERCTGKPVLETFERRTAESVNQDRYEVLTTAQWLARFNAAVRVAGGVQPSNEALRVLVQP